MPLRLFQGLPFTAKARIKVWLVKAKGILTADGLSLQDASCFMFLFALKRSISRLFSNTRFSGRFGLYLLCSGCLYVNTVIHPRLTRTLIM